MKREASASRFLLFSSMKNWHIPALVILALTACNDPGSNFSEEVKDPGSNFSEEFKKGYIKSCRAQAMGMSPAEAKELCECSLNQIFLNWNSEEEATKALNGMHMNEVQRRLVNPCVKK